MLIAREVTKQKAAMPTEEQIAAIKFTDMIGCALAHRDEALALELPEEHRRSVGVRDR